jgi:hypothetical protein
MALGCCSIILPARWRGMFAAGVRAGVPLAPHGFMRLRHRYGTELAHHPARPANWTVCANSGAPEIQASGKGTMRAISRSRAMCEWNDFAGDGDHIRALLARGESGTLPPFHLLSQPGIGAGEQRACSELWMRDRLAAAQGERAAMDLRFGQAEREKIRLGYTRDIEQLYETMWQRHLAGLLPAAIGAIPVCH